MNNLFKKAGLFNDKKYINKNDSDLQEENITNDATEV